MRVRWRALRIEHSCGFAVTQTFAQTSSLFVKKKFCEIEKIRCNETHLCYSYYMRNTTTNERMGRISEKGDQYGMTMAEIIADEKAAEALADWRDEQEAREEAEWDLYC